MTRVNLGANFAGLPRTYLTTPMSNSPDLSFPCTVSPQGEPTRSAVAVGRIGRTIATRILVRYQTARGQRRERWLPVSRVQGLNSLQRVSLPLYERTTCPGGAAETIWPLTVQESARRTELWDGSLRTLADSLERRGLDAKFACAVEKIRRSEQTCPCNNVHDVIILQADDGSCEVMRLARVIIRRAEVRS